MNTKRILSYLSASIVLLAASAVNSAAFAQTCGQYGTSACPPQDLSIDKKIKHPINGDFVDNLQDKDGEFYSPGSEIIYLLKIKNSGTSDFGTVQITDNLPEWINVPNVENVIHQDDKNKVTDVKVNGREIKFVLKESLKAGAEIEVRLKVTVVSDLKLSNNETKRCSITNNANVKAADRSDDDSATFCAITTVAGVKKLPEAGPEDYLPLLPFALIAFTGMKLLLKRGS